MFSVDGKYVYFCNAGVLEVTPGHNDIYVFEVETEKLVSKISGHTKPVTSMAISSCGRYLASGDFAATVIIWDLVSSPTNPKIIGNKMVGQNCAESEGTQVSSITFSGNSQFVYAVHDDQQNAMFDPKVFGYVVNHPEHRQVCGLGMFDEQKIYHVSTSGCGKMIIGCTERKDVRVFQIAEDGMLQKKYDVEGLAGHTMHGCSSCDNKFALCDRNNFLYLLDLNDNGKRLILGKIGIERRAHQYVPCWSPDGSLLVCPGQGFGDLRVYAIVAGDEKGAVRKVKADEKMIYTGLSFSADNTQINLTGGEKGEEKESVAV